MKGLKRKLSTIVTVLLVIFFIFAAAAFVLFFAIQLRRETMSVVEFGEVCA